MKNKAIILAGVLTVPGLFFAHNAHAICPVCTVAVGAGVGLSRWLGIDDTITGVWFGALMVSIILWTLDWLSTKKIAFFGQEIIVALGYYLMAFAPLYYTDILGHHYNRIWGMDKLIVGVATGSILFYLTNLLYVVIKKRNGGRAHFPYQKVAMPVGVLSLASLLFYLLTR